MTRRIAFDAASHALHGIASTRAIEAAAAATLPPHTLMQRAGLAVARLALAIAPHARRVWVAAGPGNNGGDGFEAARHLHAAGREVHLSALGDPARLPPDAAASLAAARAAGVVVAGTAPDTAPDLVIDALLGLGASRAPDAAMAALIDAMNRVPGPRLAIDLPSGLHAERGQPLGDAAVQATHTLSLLTLKPGLFTGAGREASGELWFDALDVASLRDAAAPDAWCVGGDLLSHVRPPRGHGGHKGRYGDVLAVGGAPGMGGALMLAARAALAGGAGRVFASALDPAAAALDVDWPELMWRPTAWRDSGAWDQATTVAGCGGGDEVRAALPALLSRSPRLVLDADALNALAADPNLQAQLRARAGRGLATVLTPHPLEAARLLALADARAVQADRVAAAQALADRLACSVLLKGSGSIVAAPDRCCAIVPTGDARLASAGTGDVLAGWLAGLWSAAQGHGSGTDAHTLAQAAAWSHGAAVEGCAANAPLTASRLLRRLSERE